MRMLNLDKENNKLDLLNKKNTLAKQNNAISEILSNVINWSIDAGIRYFLPNTIENEVIKIKNHLLNNNVQEKIKGTIENIMNIGKQKLDIGKNEISNIEQLEKILMNPDTIKIISETVSKILEDKNINIVNNEKNQNNKYLSKNIENNLNNEITKQINSMKKIEEYTKDWYKNFDNKDFESMNKVYKKIKRELKNIIPLENLIKETKKIENLNQLIKSKGGDFNITKEELELANRLVY